MQINCLASSSAGNSYVLRNEQDTILIEAGLDLATTKSRLTSLNIKLSDIDAVLITHKHGDHCNKKTVERIGINTPVISNKSVLETLDISYGWMITPEAPVIIKSFKIWAFELDHDVDTYGYIIEDGITKEKLLFINDTKLVRWNFNKYNFKKIMIECNHIHKLTTKTEPYRRRSIKSHMSLAATLKTLTAMNLKATEEIYLMHLSDDYSDERVMKQEIQRSTGVPTYVCLKNGGTA